LKVLVTGGAGFIGSTFVRQAVREVWDVAVLDALTYAGDLEESVLKLQTKEKLLKSDIIFPMQSFQSLLVICFGTNGRNPQGGKDFTIPAT